MDRNYWDREVDEMAIDKAKLTKYGKAKPGDKKLPRKSKSKPMKDAVRANRFVGDGSEFAPLDV